MMSDERQGMCGSGREVEKSVFWDAYVVPVEYTRDTVLWGNTRSPKTDPKKMSACGIPRRAVIR